MMIETDRLIIRDFEPSDVQSLFAYTSQNEVMHYLPEEVQTIEEARKFVAENMGDEARHFPVCLKENGQLIGHLAFYPYFGNHTYEIGWVFNPTYFNNGYATEAAFATLKYGFEKMGLHRIIATCQPENIASYRIMEKIGMRKEGFFKKCIPYGDEWWDEYYYAILNEEWGR